MSFSDLSRTLLKNNKREKHRLLDSFKDIRDKRILPKDESKLSRKKMPKKELLALRISLQRKENLKRFSYWFVFIGAFLSIFVYLIYKM